MTQIETQHLKQDLKKRFEPVINRLFAVKLRREREREFGAQIKEIRDVQEKKEFKREFFHRETVQIQTRNQKISIADFEVIKVIGHGGFGVVQLVRENATGEIYAMKTITKSKTIDSKQQEHVIAERRILSIASEVGEWIVRLFYSFQDTNYLYFVMEYMAGGDLLGLLIKLDTFSEDFARFYFAEITLAIEEVHKLGMIHRDIKPDNFLLDSRGHIRLADFGLAWHSDQVASDLLFAVPENELKEEPIKRRDRAFSVVGTNNYVAPEVLRGIGYDKSCDWWSAGIILFEMIFGYPPFSSSKGKFTRTKILNWEKFIEYPESPPSSNELVDLCKHLICEAEARCGSRKIPYEGLDNSSRMVLDGDAGDIKAHPWFANFDWEDIGEQTAPFVPKLTEKADTSNFEEVDAEKIIPMLDPGTFEDFATGKDFFAGFSYTNKNPLTDKDK